MEGWIKLYRQVLDNPIVCKDSDHIAVWMYILLNATHKEYPAVFSGKKIIMQPGQLITGRKTIAEKFNIDESKVQRILKRFENEQQIEQQNGNKNRLISVLSWSDYQVSEQQNEQQVNNNCTTTEQQVNTNKNVKNDKEEKPIVDSSECDLAFEQFYKLYPNKSGSKKKTIVKWNTLWKNKKINIDKVLEGTKNYIGYVDHRRKNGFKDLSYKNAETYVGNECWNDDYTINKQNQQTQKQPTQTVMEDDPYLEEAYAKRMGRQDA